MGAFLNGVNIAYDDVGTGQAVVLIHGFPLNRRMWRPQQAALVEAGYRVVAPDLRGFGESGFIGGQVSMSTYADDVVALMEHLSIEKAVVGGMSMGGYVLLNLLERHRHRVAAACFIVTRSNADDEATKARRLTLAEEARKGRVKIIADVFNAILFSEPTVRGRLDIVKEVGDWMLSNGCEGLAAALLAMRDRPDYTDALSNFSLPSLVIRAEQDRAVPAESATILAERLPNAGLCVIPNAGHLANLEQPADFNDCLLKFLANVA